IGFWGTTGVYARTSGGAILNFRADSAWPRDRQCSFSSTFVCKSLNFPPAPSGEADVQPSVAFAYRRLFKSPPPARSFHALRQTRDRKAPRYYSRHKKCGVHSTYSAFSLGAYRGTILVRGGQAMNDREWNTLVSVIRGEPLHPLPTAFIIDSPWLPNWAGHTILDYFTSDGIFLEDNFKAVSTFPQTIFLPGFWSEYGMCTEPSAFGSVSIWGENDFPFAMKVLHTPQEVDHLATPDPRKHGLLPFVIKRLQHAQPEMEKAGHKIRFAVARGPFNVASFLMGTPEFLEALKTEPERMHRLLQIVTDFLVAWIAYQREQFPTIDG